MAFIKRSPRVAFSADVYAMQDGPKFGIELSETRENNYITLKDRNEYEARYLNDNGPGNRGSHSIILRPFNPDVEEDKPLVLKICAYSLSNNGDRNLKRLFEREVKALNRAKRAGSTRVIEIVEDGELFIENLSFYYYVMEYADSDLATHLLLNEIPLEQKILICRELLLGVDELHSIGVYHRDIKHDNLLICSSQCKVGDLGLARFQDEESLELRKKLGAYGWEAPEAINKFYAERDGQLDSYSPADDCIVDKKSDVYQLAKVFWFVFTNRIPVGQVTKDDLRIENISDEDTNLLFNVIYNMLLQDKQRRVDARAALALLDPISRKYAVK